MIIDLDEMLEKVALRPEMYITERSIYSLHTFISGYETALYENSSLLGYTKPSVDELCFGHWVEYKYKINNSMWNWARILHHIAGSEDKALDLFFELWPQYLEEKETFSSSEPRLGFDYPRESVTNNKWDAILGRLQKNH